MPKTRQQKENTVSELTEKLGRAKSVVFTDYQGLTMSQLSELRRTLRDQKAEFTITKNNLLKLAGKGLDELEGPTATLFAYDDEISPIKTLVKALKDTQVGKIKSGILGGEILDSFKVSQLAALPSKDELRGKTVGVLAAPLSGILSVLQGNLRNLVYALDQVRLQKGGES